MENDKLEITPERMNAPSYKLLVTTPMAAIMVSGKSNSEWSSLLGSIAPIYAAAAENVSGEVKEALLTVSSLMKAGDSQIRQFFEGGNLNFELMVELSATGADVWMCKLSDGEVEKSDLIKLFEAIQAGLIETVGDTRGDNEMVEQLIQVQGKVIEHVMSLN